MSFTHNYQKKFINECIKILKPFLKKRINKNQSLVEYNTKAKFGCFDFSILDNKIDLHMPVFRFIDPQVINSKKFSKKKNYIYVLKIYINYYLLLKENIHLLTLCRWDLG